MKLSRFGERLAKTSGIGRLMDDLGTAIAQGCEVCMLGGGNPAHIPEVEAHFRRSAEQLLAADGLFERAIGEYDPPQGNAAFIDAVACLLREQFGWDIAAENIALTNGSQSAFFILFNLFAGPSAGGVDRKILLPLTPEYIGYSDVGLTEDIFVSNRPQIEHLDGRFFKYKVDFDKLKITDAIGAICVSRPTNPTGNVLTDCEMNKLDSLARSNGVPLIIDNAYGTPFPNIIFTDAKPLFNANTIVCMSLSKLGLPAARTGIVIADPKIIRMIAETNAVMSLAPGGMGPAIAASMIRSGEVLAMSRDMIRPFYKAKADFAVDVIGAEFAGANYHIHTPEGAIFLWLWLADLPITSMELYERLKRRGVIVVPGNYFFPGLAEAWSHKNQCIRINYSADARTVERGLRIIAEEVKAAF
ncbi:MAG: valine--pyruvate transaminase [Phycisphaerae bacterium]|nr:valine--pyruvate transaminase [Phycisphaerae bacterium]